MPHPNSPPLHREPLHGITHFTTNRKLLLYKHLRTFTACEAIENTVSAEREFDIGRTKSVPMTGDGSYKSVSLDTESLDFTELGRIVH